MAKQEHGVAIERWGWQRRQMVRSWLEENFGPHGDLWYEEQDYDLETLVMDEQVYVMYMLRWS